MSDNVNYQLPPTEITDWVKWRMLWDLAMRMNLLSDVSFGPPTTPEEYQQLVSYINSLLNTGSGGNILPAIKQGSTVLPAVSQNAQYALMAINPTNPANVGTISAQPIEGIVTGGGSIGTIIATISGGSYGAVKKSVAVLSVASILATTIGAFQMAQEKIDDLFFAVDPYVDDNDNVMTYTDENGKTYLPHDFIEAIRQKLIEMGAYDTVPVINAQFTYTGANGVTGYFNLDFYRTFTRDEIYDELSLISDGQVIGRTLSQFKNKVPRSTLFYGYVYGQANKDSYLFRRNIILPIVRTNTSTEVYFKCLYKRPIDGAVVMNAYSYNPKSVTPEQLIENFKTAVDAISPTSSFQSVKISGASSDSYGIGRYQFSPNSFTQDYFYYGNYSYFDALPIVSSEYTSLVSDPILFGFNTSGQGVEGITIQEGATVPSDSNKSLEDYFPAWTAQGKVFNTVTLGADRAIQSIGQTTFLPATLKDVQPFEEGTTQDQTQAQAGTPQENADITSGILPAIQEFIDSIITSPDIPTPTIPAEDRGDSPTPVPPVITGAGSDLIAIYNPTKQQLKDFNSFLWSLDPTQLVNWKKVFVNPIEAVIALQMIYVTPITGETSTIKCGYIDSEVPSKVVTNQYVDIDCGSVDLTEYYGNIWDYVDTQVQIYLPFIGFVPLDTREVMGSNLHVKYRVDVYTGTCLAQIIVQKQNSLAVLYTYAGNCSVQLPITSGQFGALWGALIGATASMLAAGFTGGASIPAQLAIGAGELGNSLLNSNGATMQRSGGIGSNAGAMGSRVPYLIITHPVTYDADRYNRQYGYPLNETVTLGSLSGYTRVKDIHLAGISCTDDELDMIERLLKDGVIIN